MSDRPTPPTFDPYPWNQNGPGRSHRPEVMYPCDDGEWVKLDDYRDLERQRDAYAETLREFLAIDPCADNSDAISAIRERHPELAGDDQVEARRE